MVKKKKMCKSYCELGFSISLVDWQASALVDDQVGSGERRGEVKRDGHGALEMPTQQTAGIALVIDCERFSNSHKLYRVTALVLKFIQLLKKQATSPELEGQPVPAPEQPPLPKFRVRESPPFTHTAVDFASPLYVKVRKQVKCGICLFTCCVSRAVHLEIVFDISTTAFLRCVKRFAAQRGLPQRFLSDNAKTFQGCSHGTENNLGEPRHQELSFLSGY